MAVDPDLLRQHAARGLGVGADDQASRAGYSSRASAREATTASRADTSPATTCRAKFRNSAFDVFKPDES